MNGTRSDSMIATLRACERYWRATGVPRDRIADMRAELEQHLGEATAAGKPVEAVVGEDVAAFAEEWAREYRPPLPPEAGRRPTGPAVLTLVAGGLSFLSALAIPVRTTETVESCCPPQVVETSETLPGAAVSVGVALAVGALAVSAAMTLLRNRQMLGTGLLTVAAPLSLAAPVGGPWIAIGLLVALFWALRRSPFGASRSAHAWTLLSLALTVLTTLVVLFAPLTSEFESSVGPDGTAVETETRRSIVETEGLGIIWLVGAPLAVTALAAAAERTPRARLVRWVAAILMCTFVLVAILSVGLFYAPSAIAMLVAAASEGDRREAAPYPVR